MKHQVFDLELHDATRILEERDMLADAIVTMGIDLKIISPNAVLTGPHLLQICADIVSIYKPQPRPVYNPATDIAMLNRALNNFSGASSRLDWGMEQHSDLYIQSLLHEWGESAGVLMVTMAHALIIQSDYHRLGLMLKALGYVSPLDYPGLIELLEICAPITRGDIQDCIIRIIEHWECREGIPILSNMVLTCKHLSEYKMLILDSLVKLHPDTPITPPAPPTPR